jgi:hypothetical protein
MIFKFEYSFFNSKKTFIASIVMFKVLSNTKFIIQIKKHHKGAESEKDKLNRKQ